MRSSATLIAATAIAAAVFAGPAGPDVGTSAGPVRVPRTGDGRSRGPR